MLLSLPSSGDLMNNSRKLKIVLLGDRSVGKSSIIRRFTSNHFQQQMSPTVGVDFMTKHLRYKDTSYKLQLWDTAGQQKYRSLVKGYLKGADVCIFVYDVTKLQSYQTLQEWINIFESVSANEAYKIIVGNKIDMFEQSEALKIKRREIKSRLNKVSELNQMEISAKTGSNIEQLFEQILHQCWFSKTMLDIGTSKTIKVIPSQKNINGVFKDKYNKCCG